MLYKLRQRTNGEVYHYQNLNKTNDKIKDLISISDETNLQVCCIYLSFKIIFWL